MGRREARVVATKAAPQPTRPLALPAHYRLRNVLLGGSEAGVILFRRRSRTSASEMMKVDYGVVLPE